MARLTNETSLNRLFNKHTDSGYVMVSACRNDWVPHEEDDEAGIESNHTQCEEIYRKLRAMQDEIGDNLRKAYNG